MTDQTHDISTLDLHDRGGEGTDTHADMVGSLAGTFGGTTGRARESVPDHAVPDAFQLIALPRDGAAGRWRDLGSFPNLDSALLARVEDVLEQLARNDGWLITCEHLVLTPQWAAGPRVAGHVTQLGADPGSDRVPPPHDEHELRSWLLTASGLTPARPPV